MHYQPVVRLDDGGICGVEALLRWRHPELGLVPPGDFIPLAEMTGLVIAFSPWVLRTACAQARDWHAAGHSDLGVAVNLSARQFQHPDLPGQVKRALEESKLDPAFLELEVSETSAMQAPEASTQTLRALKALGVRIAIDDFGTGSSSLRYLRRFPIDALKIDRHFVEDLPDGFEDAAIVRAVVQLARGLDLRVIAEGVETQQQLDFLQHHACPEVQGYHFSYPVPAGEFEGFLSGDGLKPILHRAGGMSPM